MIKLLIITLTAGLLLSGCAAKGVQEVDASAVHYELTYQVGVVEHIKPVVVKDDGTGTFVGAIAGTVLGSMIGEGNGNTLATLLGGLGGAYAGKEVAKANAQELSVALDDGRHVVVIAKGNNFHIGERVRIVKHNGIVYSVEAF